MSTKDTNPKDAVGTGKAPISTVSAPVMAEVGIAMLEGARKYGRHNYRVSGVRASVYYDAVKNRHLAAWWEGEDDDPDSDLSHITKAIAGLVVLRDSMIQGNWIDDRPPPSPKGWLVKLNAKAAAIIAKFPEAKEPFLATDTPADVDRKLGRAPDREAKAEAPVCKVCAHKQELARAQGSSAFLLCDECARTAAPVFTARGTIQLCIECANTYRYMKHTGCMHFAPCTKCAADLGATSIPIG